ncbi:MAG: diacylglycerol kinase family protein [Patescibacteria group bacterium]
MYFYIYDDFVAGKRFEKEMAKIETRLTDLGISGQVARLALFRNAQEMIGDEVRRGLSTVVVVGNDDTIRKVIDAVADNGMTFGIIPLGDSNTIADLLGIPYGVKACDILSARIVETIDIGVINGKRFISGVRGNDFTAKITCDGYSIEPKTAGRLEVNNLTADDGSQNNRSTDPKDGKLDTMIQVHTTSGLMRKRGSGKSRFSLKFLKIDSKDPFSLYVDGGKVTGNEFEIGVQPLGLKLITGRSRIF